MSYLLKKRDSIHFQVILSSVDDRVAIDAEDFSPFLSARPVRTRVYVINHLFMFCLFCEIDCLD